jgi:uncharacterized protein (TIGR03085 family)
MARSERAAICETFRAVGPDAPTLCRPWTTRDLAAHLVLRESRPDAALGIIVRQTSGWTERVQADLAADEWDRLVHRVADGPPRWSPVRISRVDHAVNSAEFFIHHEDVRRAQPSWRPRELSDAEQRQLWGLVRGRAGFHFRHAPGSVTLRQPDGSQFVVGDEADGVTLTGAAGELMLYMNGRRDHALVELSGNSDSITAFQAMDLKV